MSLRSMHVSFLGLLGFAGLAVVMPTTAFAQAEACPVGKRVASPTGMGNQYYQSVILGVDVRHPDQCRVHPLGYSSDDDSAWPPGMLKDPSTATKPIGPNAADPHLLAARPSGSASTPAPAPARTMVLLPGTYVCAKPDMSFTIVDGANYRDATGRAGTVLFDAKTGSVVFRGGKLHNIAGMLTQPAAGKPATITFTVSGDSCPKM